MVNKSHEPAVKLYRTVQELVEKIAFRCRCSKSAARAILDKALRSSNIAEQVTPAGLWLLPEAREAEIAGSDELAATGHC